MGEVIVMSRPRPIVRPFVGESAAILFFTGVRYSRLDDAATAPAPAAVRRRRAARIKKPIETSLVG